MNMGIKIKPRFLFTIFLSASLFNLSAQDTSNTIGNVSLASPTAASLGKYGDIPVSYNTGIPNISIPIYTVQSGSLKLPISLSYHAGGLKVEENASWVGAGWSLNAGGVITRTVIGAPDDRGNGSYSACTNGHYSDYGFNSYLFFTGNGGYTINGVTTDDGGFQRGVKDGQPDLFFFNFGGYTGKFYFNDDRTPILVPEQDFKIVPDLLNGPNNMGFQGFVVTTPDGVKYYFGKTGNYSSTVTPIEISVPATLQNGYSGATQAVSSWFLNKIVSADGMDSITLGYGTQAETYSSYTLTLFPLENTSVQGAILGTAQNGYNVVKNFVNGVRLSSITFPNGTITFAPASSPRTDLTAGYTTNSGMYDAANTTSYALGSISIANSSGFCKKDSFYYGYFHDPNALTLNTSTYGSWNINSDSYRLRLDSVQEYSCDASIKVPPYKFSYFTELVPRKLSFGIDHWGFSNGVTTNQSLIPSYSLVTATGSIIQSIPGAKRDAAWPAMRGGALQQITYPTGGYTSLVFQPNDTYVTYTNYVNTYRTAMSCGYDGHNGNLGDGGDNPDTLSISGTGNTFQFILSNSSGGGSGQLEIFNSGTNTLAYNVGGATAGQTDTFYLVLPPGNYWMELTKSPATSGNGITANISENVPSSYTGNDTVGGLRIQTITNNDGMSPTTVTTSYRYTVGTGPSTQSSGILYSRPVYVQTLRNDVWGLVYASVTNCSNGCLNSCNGAFYFISPASITPMATVQGNHIGYNQVQVSQSNNGYSIYRYYGSNIWDNLITDVCTRTLNQGTCASTIPNTPAPPAPFEPMRGELKYEGHFNQNGQVLKDVTYFPQYSFDSLTTPGLIYLSGVSDINTFTQYLLQSAYKVKDSSVSTVYDPVNSNYLSTINMVYYGSLFHHQPTRKVSTTSTSDSLATNIKYTFDFRIPSCDAVPDSLPFYMNKVRADSVHVDSMLRFTCSPGLGKWLCLSDTFVNFRFQMSQARQQFVNYRRRSFANDTSNLVSTCYLAALPTSDTLLKPILRLQNMFDNAPIETSSWKDLNLVHANFTRYDTSTSPIGYAYTGRTKLINLQVPSSTFTNAAVSGTTISKDNRYVDESFYTFSNGNPIQVLPHDGITNSYIWDYLNTEPIAKVSNAVQADIAYTSFEADGKGNWAFTGTPVADASSPTGAKCYGLASGSISKAGLTSGTTYIVSYWSKTGSSFTVTGSTAVKQGKTINGWTYFEHAASGATTITVSGSGSIDELRLYPSTAQMTTYAYTPLLGMTAACDADNKITYYFYDGLGRFKWVKDQDLNIVKTIQYHYQTVTGTFY